MLLHQMASTATTTAPIVGPLYLTKKTAIPDLGAIISPFDLFLPWLSPHAHLILAPGRFRLTSHPGY
jgi:hypothetical protein